MTVYINGVAQGEGGTPDAHKDSHDPEDGSDKLDCAAPGAIDENASAEGSAHSFARSDHKHQHTAALHENGGGAEISLAGLDGEGAELTTHKANTTIAHGAVSAATASKHVVRDASARAKFAAPGAAGDALIKGTRVTTAELPAMTDEKYWVGTGANVEERDVPAAGDGATKEFFVPITFGSQGGIFTFTGKYPVVELNGDNEYAFGSFFVPADFTSITTAEVLAIARAAQANGDIDLYSEYHATGEAYTTHQESDEASTFAMTDTQGFVMDISGILSSLSAGDRVGILIRQSAAGHDLDVLGIHFKYA